MKQVRLADAWRGQVAAGAQTLVVNRRCVGVWSIVGGLATSLMVDAVNSAIIPMEPTQQDMVLRAVALLGGQLGISCAYGILQTVAHGTNTGDAIVLRVAEVLPGSYTVWRMVYDGACLAAGMLIGGVVGIGTVLYVLVNVAIVTRAAAVVTSWKIRMRRSFACE